ncbi:MAG: TOMM precursor leader peptide-binding protein [Euryarchaeota archaeon]|nr:TOMM precursor leader peptide-binding protein [Euryarchaeota archaeon]
MGKKLLIRSESDNEVFLLTGKKLPLLSKLMPLLDGTRSEKEILDTLKDFDSEYIDKLLQNLKEKGIIEYLPSTTLNSEEIKRYTSQLLLFSHANASSAQHILKKSRVAILGLGEIGSKVLTSLTISGIGEITGIDWNKVTKDDVYKNEFYKADDIGKKRAKVGAKRVKSLNSDINYIPIDYEIKDNKNMLSLVEKADFLSVCLDQEDSSVLRQMNDICLESKTSWSSCYIRGLEGIVGPTIIPYRTACYHCYELRMGANIRHYEEYRAYQEYKDKHLDRRVEFGGTNSFASIVGSMFSLEVIKFLTKIKSPATLGKLLTINFYNMIVEAHPILKFPRCPKCGIDRKDVPEEMIWNV